MGRRASKIEKTRVNYIFYPEDMENLEVCRSANRWKDDSAIVRKAVEELAKRVKKGEFSKEGHTE